MKYGIEYGEKFPCKFHHNFYIYIYIHMYIHIHIYIHTIILALPQPFFFCDVVRVLGTSSGFDGYSNCVCFTAQRKRSSSTKRGGGGKAQGGRVICARKGAWQTKTGGCNCHRCHPRSCVPIISMLDVLCASSSQVHRALKQQHNMSCIR